MMINAETHIARKYAQAFLNVSGDCISLDDYKRLYKVQEFFQQHHTQLFFLSLPMISRDDKVAYLKRVFDCFGVSVDMTQLVTLLVYHKRAHSMGMIVRFICRLYKKEHNIARFQIQASHALRKDELEVIIDFLARTTRKTIVYDYMINKKLIAGIRLQSDTAMWEHSIARQLERVQLPLIR